MAPRDIVARSIVREMLTENEAHVYLDATHFEETTLSKHFPTILESCRTVGIEPNRELIPVLPAAHYSCGGIAVDQYSKTNLEGLFAIGECSSTGLHGANRLASNSLLESIVFSHRAAMKSVEHLDSKPLDASFYATIPDWNGHNFQENNQQQITRDLRKKLTTIMSEKVGIFKTTEGLTSAQKTIRNLYFEIVELYKNNTLSSQICELRNMISVAYVLVNQSLEINENKGVFYNENYDT